MSLADLHRYLRTCTPTSIEEDSKVIQLLAECWDTLSGSNDGGMEADKLCGRVESLEWCPPYLSFKIERHGGTVNGSSRAEMQSWTINVETGTADYRIVGHRQLRPMNPPFKAKPFVDELVASVLDGKVDDRFKFDDGGDLRINAGRAVPGAGIPKQTLIERRKRFRTALCDRLKEAGWTEVSPYRFRQSCS